MSTIEEQLATAIVAKMPGVELQRVDEHTISQSSSGPATRIDPKSFLPGAQQHQQHQQDAIIAAANREAEMAYPLPPDYGNQSQPMLQTFTGAPTILAQPQADPNQLTFDFLDEATTKKSLKQLDLIVDYLYSINNKLDKVLSKRD